ncbi:MAG: PKD domain-containing protein, partial [Tepidiformaceae bacterium]
MHSTRTGAWLPVLTFFVLVLAVAAGTGGRSSVSAAVGPLTNAGFESNEAGWSFVGPDAAKVVGTEGPADFSAYAGTPDGDIKVSPNLGTKMARLGTPKASSSSQQNGINSISQTFTPSSSTFKFSARLFSWENRPNTDYVSFDFTTNSGAIHVGSFQPSADFKKSGGSVVVSCSGTSPCRKAIDVGNRGDYLNSGWVVVTVTGLPTNEDVTFTASIGSTANNALASWLYLDNVNTPPVAAFDFNYPTVSLTGGVAKTNPLGPFEGSPIQFKDLSTDPDAGDKVVAWEWTVGSLAPLTVQNPFFVPHNNGAYSVTLKVTDSFGATNSTTKSITVLNAPPLVNALNVEAIAGKPFPVT